MFGVRKIVDLCLQPMIVSVIENPKFVDRVHHQEADTEVIPLVFPLLGLHPDNPPADPDRFGIIGDIEL